MIPNIIDIEASGFGINSFPIEIGVILNTGERYCSLIKPKDDWTHWSIEAENIHNISRKFLHSNGKTISEVATELNQFLQNKTVYSDGWVVDKPWLTELFVAARISSSFSIRPLEYILTELQMEIWHETKNDIINELGITRHRASHDALVIQETYRRTQLKNL